MLYLEKLVKKSSNLTPEIIYTRNIYSVIYGRRTPRGTYTLRLHKIFKHADRGIQKSLANFLFTQDKRASEIIGDYIDKNRKKIIKRRKSIPHDELIEKGEFFDLVRILKEINRAYFDNQIETRITWGLHRGKYRSKSINLGYYIPEDNLIVISPLLDRPFVPRYVITNLIYHEMLHIKLKSKKIGKRTIFHTSEFKKCEKEFEYYAEASMWENKNIKKILK